MRFQSNQASCGPAALRNALLCHGIVRSEQELEQLTGCTAPDGTTPKGLIRALKLIAQEHPSVVPAILHESRDDVAILKVVQTLMAGSVLILCVDSNEHWVVAFGLLGGAHNAKIHVSDSADSEMVLHYSPSELLARWGSDNKKKYYGIAL